MSSTPTSRPADLEASLDAARTLIERADALLVAAGAGLGVDSGLPDFRGDQGFWNAYPAYSHLGLRFSDLANPRWFGRDPQLAWGFYGHRLALYREREPHAGYAILARLLAEKSSFVFTSNVDGHFQRAGVPQEKIYEVHGSIHWLQCSLPCCNAIWAVPAETQVEVDAESFRATDGTWPMCPACERTARPNIIMFSDWTFVDERTHAQHERYRAWLAGLHDARLVVLELGAGTSVATVRAQSEHLLEAGAGLVRINPREAQGPHGTISIPLGAREALERLAVAG